jgi:hypothetical protein
LLAPMAMSGPPPSAGLLEPDVALVEFMEFRDQDLGLVARTPEEVHRPPDEAFPRERETPTPPAEGAVRIVAALHHEEPLTVEVGAPAVEDIVLDRVPKLKPTEGRETVGEVDLGMKMAPANHLAENPRSRQRSFTLSPVESMTQRPHRRYGDRLLLYGAQRPGKDLQAFFGRVSETRRFSENRWCFRLRYGPKP